MFATPGSLLVQATRPSGLVATGVLFCKGTVNPVPSWPLLLRPQHFTVALSRSAQVCAEPGETCLAVLNPLTGTGTKEFSVVPFPSWPYSLPPQHFTVVSESSAHAWSGPRATVLAVLNPLTSTGTEE